eukprot:5270665-Amphidinium_carterae.2
MSGTSSAVPSCADHENDLSLALAHSFGAGLDDASAAEALSTGNIGANTLAALNAKNRSSSWISSTDPYGRLLLLKVALMPLSDLLYQQFEASSAKYEDKQRGALARAMLSGSWSFQSRDYMIVQAACGDLVANFFAALSKLYLSDTVWSCMPASCLNVAFQSLSHRVLARAGASVFELYMQPQREYPTCLFTLLRDNSQHEKLANGPECMKCHLTKTLQRTYPTFSEAGFLETLQSLAMLQRIDISNVESNHGSIKRQVVYRSTQAKLLSLPAASAYWVFQTARSAWNLHHRGKVKQRPKLKRKVHKSGTHPIAKVSV